MANPDPYFNTPEGKKVRDAANRYGAVAMKGGFRAGTTCYWYQSRKPARISGTWYYQFYLQPPKSADEIADYFAFETFPGKGRGENCVYRVSRAEAEKLTKGKPKRVSIPVDGPSYKQSKLLTLVLEGRMLPDQFRRTLANERGLNQE